jgi:hypothetical protein
MSPQTETKASVGFQAGILSYFLHYLEFLVYFVKKKGSPNPALRKSNALKNA